MISSSDYPFRGLASSDHLLLFRSFSPISPQITSPDHPFRSLSPCLSLSHPHSLSLFFSLPFHSQLDPGLDCLRSALWCHRPGTPGPRRISDHNGQGQGSADPGPFSADCHPECSADARDQQQEVVDQQHRQMDTRDLALRSECGPTVRVHQSDQRARGRRKRKLGLFGSKFSKN